MDYSEDKKIKRRGVLLGLGRFGALGLLGGLAVFSEAKRRKLVSEGKCVDGWVCSGCGEFGKCGLPQAVSYRQSRDGKGGV